MITDISLSTPGMLFSTVSLVMLAYTNRFVAIAKLIRDLYDKYQLKPDASIVRQIHLLRKRVGIIKRMQLLCMASLLLSTASMILVLNQSGLAAAYMFGMALLLLLASLAYSVYEITLSTRALNISIADIEALWPVEETEVRFQMSDVSVRRTSSDHSRPISAQRAFRQRALAALSYRGR